MRKSAYAGAPATTHAAAVTLGNSRRNVEKLGFRGGLL
jgi:hypothetical protein